MVSEHDEDSDGSATAEVGFGFVLKMVVFSFKGASVSGVRSSGIASLFGSWPFIASSVRITSGAD